MSFPVVRMRRLRRNPLLRRMVQETRLEVFDLVAPLFVKEGIAAPEPIASMPGQYQHTLDSLVRECEELVEVGVPAVILFGIPARKDPEGSGASDPNGIIQRALRRIREEFGERLLLITDLCMCEYTSHGHCGIVRNGTVDNDRTLDRYREIAISQAAAGADIIAPSGMMDGQVRAIREALDGAGYQDIAILAYAAKYASSLYGPFREAAESAPKFGDRRSYQMDIANREEAIREVSLDIEEGADMVMVKPALPNLDILAKIKELFRMPTAAYNVSGEYAMVKAAAQQGWLDERATVVEILTAIKRAGADVILTYFAKDAAHWLRERS
ncbi:MAG: porphobilinogen synthase [Armatimonadota bacterium]|nr:porphobilinogen synthase [Armatimonadota bacterium]MDR7434341.1 porphobilinogen synthase [Armatimonadota bacterium]